MNRPQTIAVVHTHTHTDVLNKTKKAQITCAKLRYKDGLIELVCLFCVPNSS